MGHLLKATLTLKLPAQCYSIIVSKLNDKTFQPVPGIKINLYKGTGCQGPPIDNEVTDQNGIVDFINLEPNQYSVEEKLKGSGWT
ncbi:MAG: hypothetical protein IH959_04765, partial [Chloroflexi bacterium]|nr:hypothetical protein [Chloroflexota bacterium]